MKLINGEDFVLSVFFRLGEPGEIARASRNDTAIHPSIRYVQQINDYYYEHILEKRT